MTQSTNRLIHETSPYLLQHAYNPVDWYPWGTLALEKAVELDLPILLSIGYSACHWCHVMEHESFEDEGIAEIMNNNFVCIKLDREERPDIDQIYMEAIQSMGIPGGWPLNIFLTPSQKPFYGGTYFPPERWGPLLENIAKAFRENRKSLEESADKFKDSLNVGVVEKYGLSIQKPEGKLLENAAVHLSAGFDPVNGGMSKAPKFPMPVIWNFILHYSARHASSDLIDHLYLTLDKMAQGGIYDQIGGGFARYSVDDKWFAPHFEKMLYDNAQLVGLYAHAYSRSGNKEYQTVVYQTIEFLTRELRSPEGAFYSALDADSEGVEGKYYVWELHEFQEIVGTDGEFMVELYGLTPEGNWEQGKNILYRRQDLDSFALKHGINATWLGNTVLECHEKLLKARYKRVRPGLDDKIICGWNGLMIKGLVDAYSAFSEQKFLNMALDCAEFIEKHLRSEDQLFRIYHKDRPVPGFLEDYAGVISGYLALYQATFQEKWLFSAQNLMSFAIDNFYDQRAGLFYYTGKNTQSLIARKMELFDNVIPSSNSIMAGNLWVLGTILSGKSYLDFSNKMISRVNKLIPNDPAYMSNWATVLSFMEFPTAEVVIGGKDAELKRRALAAHFHPHKVMIGSSKESSLPLLRGRVVEDETNIYICYNQTCQLPTSDPEIAIGQLSY